MATKQKILFLRNATAYENQAAAKSALDALTHSVGQPVVATYSESGSTKILTAIGKTNGTGSTAYEILATSADLVAALASIAEVTGALDDHKKVVASASALGHVKSGGDVTVGEDGTMSVEALASKAPLASPAFTGTPTAPTAASGSDESKQIATCEYVATEIANKLAAAQALTFKGILTGSQALPTSGVKVGDLWVVGNGFTSEVAGEKVEVGDFVICTATGDSITWQVIQKNIDGYVIGAASSVDGNIVLFNGTGGKNIKDSGKSLSDFVSSDVEVEEGDGIKVEGDLVEGLTISHQDKPTTGTKTGEEGKYVSAVTVDSLGHVASVEVATLPSESGKVKVVSTGTADYLGNQFDDADVEDNEIAVEFEVNESNKVTGKVTIDTIDGGTY